MNLQNGSPDSPLTNDDGSITFATEAAQAGDTNDVIETELPEETEGFQPQLVEGDFFPAAADNIGMDFELIAELADSSNRLMMTESEIEIPTRISKPRRSALSKGGKAKRQKRVRWADEVGPDSTDTTGRPLHQRLMKHVTAFYMPLSSQKNSLCRDEADNPNYTAQFPTVGPPPPSIFREKENTDGSVYKFCKAQRPSMYFIEWKRQPHGVNQVPFLAQPVESDAAPQKAITLFSALHPKEPKGIPGDHAKARIATSACAPSRCPQLPFIRIDTLLNEPLRILL
ncbi:unnamed protein product [Phytomonas sp. EM1]|nr:unnamed protein product [Phytomonas sp. EM1]|eukprot:CCW63137.1 unnamed protein product [Phytomonas sp. isolate EM1]